MRKAKWYALILSPALALIFLCTQATTSSAADQGQPVQSTKNEKSSSVEAYRVNYKISELENRKTIDS